MDGALMLGVILLVSPGSAVQRDIVGPALHDVAKDLAQLSHQVLELEAATKSPPAAAWSSSRCDTCCKGVMAKAEMGREVGACRASGESHFEDLKATGDAKDEMLSCASGKKEEMYGISLNAEGADDQCNYKCAFNDATDGNRCGALGEENVQLPERKKSEDEQARAGIKPDGPLNLDGGFKGKWQPAQDAMNPDEEKLAKRFPKAKPGDVTDALKKTNSDQYKAGCELNQRYPGFDEGMQGPSTGKPYGINELCDGFIANMGEFVFGGNW